MDYHQWTQAMAPFYTTKISCLILTLPWDFHQPLGFGLDPTIWVFRLWGVIELGIWSQNLDTKSKLLGTAVQQLT